jgi:dTDP-4-amino-4,6-dideoxygalactose transaminase
MIPINDLSRINSKEIDDLNSLIVEILNSGWYIHGPHLKSFETDLSIYLGANYCAGVGNGTDALTIALKSIDVGQGDKVFVTANAGGYGTGALVNLGAIPIFVDVDTDVGLISLDDLEIKLKTNTGIKCIIVTHLYGNAASMPEIMELAQKFQVKVIEDCAQSIGAKVGGKLTGTWGDISTFSFFPTKNLGALGDAGAVVSNSKSLGEAVLSLRQYGWSEKYKISRAHGQNSRLDEIQAAILSYRLKDIDSKNEKRRAILSQYEAALRGTGAHSMWFDDDRSVGHLAVIRVNERDKVRQYLADSGISTDVHYPINDYDQTPWAGEKLELPNTSKLNLEIMTLPCFPTLAQSEIDHICSALEKI